MAEVPHFTVVAGDDWSGIYRNGVLVTEGHRFTAVDLAEIMFGETCSVSRLAENELVDLYLQQHGSFPLHFSELVVKASTIVANDG